jgi:hypothetical protein
MNAPGDSGFSFRVRLAVVGVMVVLAIAANAALTYGPLLAIVGAPLLPLGLMFVDGHTPGARGASDGATVIAAIGCYVVYAAVGAALFLAKPRWAFVASCLALAVLLSLTVKGCEASHEIRWMSS